MIKTIALMGLWEISNYGDPVLALCTKKMLQENFSESNVLEFVEISLSPKFRVSFPQRLFNFILCRLAKIIKKEERVRGGIIRRIFFRRYAKQLKNVDCIVFVGGGIIKYKIEYFDYAIEAIVDFARKNNVPVIMNAVGVEGFDSNNNRCLDLKKALNDASVKYISTRDDLSTLIGKYLDEKRISICEMVADPAVWSSECFGINKMSCSNTIGIGVARGDIFKDYGRSFSSEQMVGFYVGLVHKVLDSGMEVELFTNGLDQDNIFLEKVMSQLKAFNVRKKIPSSAKNLVEIIASYKAIVTTRMHAGIIAYSLDIPAVGLNWNDKVKFFWGNTGHPQNCVDVEKMTPENVFSVLIDVMKVGYDQGKKRVFRQTIKDSVVKFSTILN